MVAPPNLNRLCQTCNEMCESVFTLTIHRKMHAKAARARARAMRREQRNLHELRREPPASDSSPEALEARVLQRRTREKQKNPSGSTLSGGNSPYKSGSSVSPDSDYTRDMSSDIFNYLADTLGGTASSNSRVARGISTPVRIESNARQRQTEATQGTSENIADMLPENVTVVGKRRQSVCTGNTVKGEMEFVKVTDEEDFVGDATMNRKRHIEMSPQVACEVEARKQDM